MSSSPDSSATARGPAAAGHVADLRALHAVTVRVGGCADHSTALQAVLAAALSAVGASRGLLSLSDAAGRGVSVRASVGFAGEFPEQIRFVPAGLGACGTAFATRDRVVIEEVATDPRFETLRPAARAAGFVSCHSVPLLAPGGGMVGVLTAHYNERHEVDDRERALLDLYAQLAAEFAAKAVATEQLRAGEERFRMLANHAPVGIFLSDGAGDCVYVNPTWCELAGLTAAEALGKGWTRVLHPDDRERVISDWARAVAEGRPSMAEFRFLRPDGTERWLQGNAVQMHDAEGNPAGHIGTVADISERKETEDTNRMLAAIVASSLDAIVGTDLEGRIVSWNSGAERLYGFDAAEAVGESITIVVAAERQLEEREMSERVLRGERVEHFETQRRRKDGTRVDVSLTVSPIRDGDGQVIGASRIARDITERKRQEAEVRRQEKIYRAIGESIDYGIWICDAEGRNLYVSESFLKLVGMTQAECSEFGWGRVLPPEDVAPTMAAWIHSVKTGESFEREHRFKGVDGAWHPVLARGVPIRDEDGRIVYWAGLNLDIAAFKETEEALRHREQQLRLVTDNAIVFLAQCGRDYRLKFVNRPYAARFGRSPAEVVGCTIAELVGGEAFALLKPFVDTALTGQRVEFEMEIPYERLGRRWMRVIHEPERNAAGEVIGLVAVISDITARRQTEREMELARDRALAASRAKDDFLAALSHELRTPLNPVLLLASEGAADPTLTAATREAFATIRKNVELEARLIDDLLDLTRITRGKLSLNLSVENIDEILEDAIETMRSEIEEKGLVLELNRQAQETLVWADPVRLQQVLWNVLKNAVKFTGEGGRVRITTRPGANAGSVVVEIVDSGIGMTATELARVFDAFAQGDHAGGGGSHRFGGVGLGLTISRMLIGMHRGTIAAHSDGRGRGSTFTIDLPVLDAAERERHAREVRPETAQPFPEVAVAGAKRRRLLLVEDHEPTRSALALLLRRRGFEVLVAGTVAEARALAHGGGIDLLVSDIGLPDGNGYELMAELHARSRVRGIALTGYGMDHDVVRSQAAGFLVHLTKPVTIQALDSALAVVLKTET